MCGMNDEPKPSTELENTEMENWKKTRYGAWAGRGFHYQHQICTLLLVRQWADLAPHGNLIPEGFEDCVVEFPDHCVWIQIKSRKDAPFQVAEVQNFLNDVEGKAANHKGGKKTRSVIVLEQPRRGKDEAAIDMLFDGVSPDVVLCKAPDDEILNLLSSKLNTADVIVGGILSELYKQVADASAANASRSLRKTPQDNHDGSRTTDNRTIACRRSFRDRCRPSFGRTGTCRLPNPGAGTGILSGSQGPRRSYRS